MNNIVLLVYVVFSLSGAPQPAYKVLPEGAKCDEAVAVRAAHDLADTMKIKIQEFFLWDCKPVASPGEGPAAKPVLLRGQEEARSGSGPSGG